MKKPLFILFFALLVTISYSQEGNNFYEDKINIESLQVSSSAVLNLNFEASGLYVVKIFQMENNEEIKSLDITKPAGGNMIKIDFSMLHSGNYIFKVYKGTNEIKSLEFTKI